MKYNTPQLFPLQAVLGECFLNVFANILTCGCPHKLFKQPPPLVISKFSSDSPNEEQQLQSVGRNCWLIDSQGKPLGILDFVF
jgi:hypothetical protein